VYLQQSQPKDIAADGSAEFQVSLNMPDNADGGFAAKGYCVGVFLWDNNFVPVTDKFIFK
jgi:hypothetical protein